jgi:hypothetical protein
VLRRVGNVPRRVRARTRPHARRRARSPGRKADSEPALARGGRR